MFGDGRQFESPILRRRDQPNAGSDLLGRDRRSAPPSHSWSQPGPEGRSLRWVYPVRVYEQLRDLIVDGGLEADAQLVQEQVAEALGVSRTPVRDALNRLAHEGLVTWNPGRGYLVNALNTREIVEVYQVRRLLELEAARLACGRHTPVMLRRLHGLIEEMVAADVGDTSLLFELNRRFHRTLVEPCDNQQLLKILDTLWDHPVNRRITRSYVKEAGSPQTMIEEHRALLAAAVDGDEQRLLGLTSDHLRTGYDKASQSVSARG